MERPIALKLHVGAAPAVHQVALDPALANNLRLTTNRAGPAVIVTRKAEILSAISAGMIDANDLVAVSAGDWSNALLIVLPEADASTREPATARVAGDRKFLEHVQSRAPHLAGLAGQTIRAVRSAGVDGELVESERGRWVNRPLNSFTLKVQPRVGNLHFTLYGNPEEFNSGDFLLPDQNSYSRGWVRNSTDVHRFAQFARLAHQRRDRNAV
jgi:hypothetical protein